MLSKPTEPAPCGPTATPMPRIFDPSLSGSRLALVPVEQRRTAIERLLYESTRDMVAPPVRIRRTEIRLSFR
jgi:hypothetical protein